MTGTAAVVDLFGDLLPARMCVRLERSIDQVSPCCHNLATIEPHSGPHAAELRCAGCGAFRGWLPRAALEFLNSAAARFGAPGEPLILTDRTIGNTTMDKFDNSNRGVLFKNDRKAKPNDRDYGGNININGTGFWLSAWIKTSKDGAKFLSLSVKAKDADTTKKPAPATKPAGAPFDDAIGF